MKQVSAIAEMKNCHQNTVRKALRAGELRGIRFGVVWVVLEDEALREWVPRKIGRPRKAPAVKEPVGVAV